MAVEHSYIKFRETRELNLEAERIKYNFFEIYGADPSRSS